MAQRHQRGWLKKETRSAGETWMLFFRKIRKSDSRRVENKVPIGLVKHFPDKSCAWAEVERLHLNIDQRDSRPGVTFADLSQHYAEYELADRTESVHPKAHTTIRAYERVLRNRLLPRWGNRIALLLTVEKGSPKTAVNRRSNWRVGNLCRIAVVEKARRVCRFLSEGTHELVQPQQRYLSERSVVD
jgi:hypothetical protein